MSESDFLSLVKKHYSKKQYKKVVEAVKFASSAHKDQKRLSGDNYIVHPISVAQIIVEWQLDIDTVVAAILHDTVEDTDVNLNQIERSFGHDVAFLVDGVSKVSEARSGMKDLYSYLPNTKDNLSKFLIAISKDLRVIFIKLADRLHNLRTIEYLPKAKQRKKAIESIEVFAPLADRIGMGRVKIEIEELSFAVLKPKDYEKTQTILKKKLSKTEKNIEDIRDEVKQALKKEKIKAEIDGRIKSTYSLYKKLKKVNGNIDEIYDLMALRIIVESKEECYLILGLLHSMYQPLLTRIKDYISVPKLNGYQSLHTTVIATGEQIVEFQIRTKQMHEHSERGLAASFHYNEQKLTESYIENRSTELPPNMQWIVQLQEQALKIQEGEEVHDGDFNIELFSDRIFVYTPNGDIFDLPEASTALDFAYSVHTDVGHHTQAAKVNNSIVKLNHQLKNGDIVEIVTRKNIKPSPDWVKYANTSRAKQKIRAALNREEQATS